MKKNFSIKKYNKPEIRNLGKIGTKTKYGKSKAGSDGPGSNFYNPGQDAGFSGAGSTMP